MDKHATFYLKHKNSQTAVLLVHGILASPYQFRKTADLLYAKGYSVMAPLLPGHGGDIRAFSKVTIAEWQAEVADAVIQLKQSHERIILAGHSLGALLTLEQSLADKSDGMILLAPALFTKISWDTVRMSAQILFGNPAKDSDWIRFCRGIYSLVPSRWNQIFRYLPPLLNVVRLSRRVKQHLSQNTTPTLIIQSKADETVRMKSVNVLKKKMQNVQKVLIFKCSKHDYIAPEEREAYDQAIIEFIQEIIR